MIGTNDDAAEVFTMLRSQPELGYEVRGLIGDEARSRPDWAGLHRARGLDELPELARQTDATGVLVVANALSAAEVNRVIELSAANGLHVQVCPGFRGLATRRVRSVPMSGEAFLYLEPERRPTWQLVAKRVARFRRGGVRCRHHRSDTPACLRGHQTRGPGTGAVPPGPNRVGRATLRGLQAAKHGARRRQGRRSSRGNDRTDGPLFKSANDPRITRVGAIIRALSIDELPQLLNVLTGSMSLVGPRPALAAEVDQFDPELLRRHCVKPGMTGLWQVEARDNPSFHTYRRLDLFYVDNWSIGLDLVILLTTVPMLMAHALRVQEPVGAPLERRKGLISGRALVLSVCLSGASDWLPLRRASLPHPRECRTRFPDNRASFPKKGDDESHVFGDYVRDTLAGGGQPVATGRGTGSRFGGPCDNRNGGDS